MGMLLLRNTYLMRAKKVLELFYRRTTGQLPRSADLRSAWSAVCSGSKSGKQATKILRDFRLVIRKFNSRHTHTHTHTHIVAHRCPSMQCYCLPFSLRQKLALTRCKAGVFESARPSHAAQHQIQNQGGAVPNNLSISSSGGAKRAWRPCYLHARLKLPNSGYKMASLARRRFPQDRRPG